MKIVKYYLNDCLTAITALGSAYFYFLLLVFLLTINKVSLVFQIALGLLLCYAVIFIFRIFYFKERPIKEDYINFFTKINASSFPSMHTLSFTFTSIVLIKTLNNISVTIFLLIVSILVGYSRIYIKKHFFADVLYGWILGIITGLVYLALV